MPILKAADIKRLMDSLLNDVWGATHNEWKLDRDYYELEFPVKRGPEVEKVVPPTARQKVNTFADQLVTSEPTVIRRPIRDTDISRTRAEKLQVAGVLILKNFDKFSLMPPAKAFAKHLGLYGYATIYGPGWDITRWPMHVERNGRRRTNKRYLAEIEERKNKIQSVFPFWITAPHPSKTLLDPQEGKEPTFGIYRERKYAHALQRAYPDNQDLAKIQPYQMLTCRTYWSADQYHMSAGANDGSETELMDCDNPYGFIPFKQALAGYGSDSAMDTGQIALSKLCAGLLRYVRSALEGEASVKTSLVHYIWRAANQHIFTDGDAVELARLMEDNQVVPAPGGQTSIWNEAIPAIPGGMAEMMGELRSDVDQGTFGNILHGIRPQGVRTASQHAQIVSKAKQFFHVPMVQLNSIMSLFLGDCGRLLSVFEDEVTLEGTLAGKHRVETIKAEDFEDNYTFEVDYEASDPMERAASIETGLQLRSAPGPDGQPGAIDWRTFAERFAHLGNIAEIEERIAEERGMADPATHQMVMQLVQQMWQEKIASNGVGMT